MDSNPIALSPFHLKLLQAIAAHQMMLNASNSQEETFFRKRWQSLSNQLDEIASEILDDKPWLLNAFELLSHLDLQQTKQLNCYQFMKVDLWVASLWN